MITEVSAPALVIRALNEAEYKLETDNRITTPGVAYTNTLTFLALPADGEVLIFAFNSIIITLTFKTTALAANDVEIQGTIADTVTEALAVAQNQYELYKNYFIYAAGTDFEVTARETGAAWDIDFTGSTVLTGALPVSGVDEVRREGFRIQVDIYQYLHTIGSIDFYEILTSELYPPDNSEQLVVDVSPVLLAMLDYDLPAYAQAAPSMCSKVFKKFKITYGELWDDEVQNYAHSAQRRVLLAGLGEADIPGNTFYTEHFTEATGQLFLTPCPRGELRSTKEALHYLYYYQRTDYSPAYATLYIDYTDGTGSVIDQVFTLGQPGDILIIPAGYNTLDVDTLKTAGKTVKRWGIEIGANGLNHTDYTDKTEIFWVTLDGKPYQQNRYFLIANPYGGFDTLWCNGDVEFSQKTDSESYKVHKQADSATVINATERNTFGLRQASHKISTGYVSRPYLEYIAALLVFTTTAYELVNGQYRAVMIDRASIKETHSTADGKFQLTFIYKYAQEEKV